MKNVLKFLGIFFGTLFMLCVFALLSIAGMNTLFAVIDYLLTNVTENTHLVALIIMAPIVIVMAIIFSVTIYRIKYGKGETK